MKHTTGITSVESKAEFHERLLEKFVQDNLPSRRKIAGKISGLGNFSLLYQEIETCAAETPVYGTVDIFFESTNRSALRKESIPVSSRFFVFCSRDRKTDYKITCSTSLS